MTLSDLPPAEQHYFLDGITIGIGTREVGRPITDRDVLDPWHGDDGGLWWRRGFDVGFEGRHPHDVLSAIPKAED